MKEGRKTDLRRRWETPEAAALHLAAVDTFVRQGGFAGTLDLRGAVIGMDGPLADFRLSGREYSDLDLSYGSGALIIRDGTVTRMRAEGFAFDRASYWAKATLADCDISGFKGRFDATDVRFVRCDFSASTFRGGSELGFRRCTFENCTLTGAIWGNTFFKASRFANCSFTGARFERCYVAGLRFEGEVDLAALLAHCDLRSIYLNGLEVPHAPSAV